MQVSPEDDSANRIGPNDIKILTRLILAFENDLYQMSLKMWQQVCFQCTKGEV